MIGNMRAASANDRGPVLTLRFSGPVDLAEIAYRGSGPALNDTVAGQVPIIFDNLHGMHDVISDILASPKVPRWSPS